MTISRKSIEPAACPSRLWLGSRARWVVLASLMSWAALAGCQSRNVGSGSPTTNKLDLTSGGKLIYADNFNRKQLGDDWKRGKGGQHGPGKWRVENGMLVVNRVHNDPLWLQVKLPKHVRVEFDAEALSPEGDVKCEIFGDGIHHQSGYILIYGGWHNSLDVIARLAEHGLDRKAQKTRGVVPNRMYHWAVERTDGVIKWYIDGKLYMHYDDPMPLTGKGHQFFGFNDWNAPDRYDNVKIYALP